MPDENPPIVITGGSVTIDFKTEIFPPNGNGKHGNANKKLKSITIVGDGLDITQTFPTGKGVTITIAYGNSNDKP
jgi:hypothetical protein